MTSPKSEPDIFDTWDPQIEESVKPKEESWGEWLKRKAQRYALRTGEAVVGLPGDIVQSARAVAQMGPGGIIPEEKATFVQRLARKGLEALPASEELRAGSAEAFPELEPRSKFEEYEEEILGDIPALMLPGAKGKVPLLRPFMRALGMSFLGNTTKQTIRAIGVGETGQEIGKLGAMIFGGMFGKGRGVKSAINRTYNRASAFVPEGETFKYPTKKLQKVKNILSKGTLNEAKSGAMQILEDIEAKSPGGMMAVEEAVQFDKDINRAIAKAGKDKAKAGYLKQLHGAHREALDSYAETNPAWAEQYKSAKMMYAGIAQSEKMKNYFRKNVNLKNVTYGAAFLGMEESFIPGSAKMKIGSLGAIGATYMAREMGKRLMKNPALRRYYQNVLTASISENSAMLARNIKGLERTAKKEFEDDPIPADLLNFFERGIEEGVENE